MGRRDINDKEWQAVKRRVEARDNNRDRMQFALSLAEYKTLRSNAGSYISKIDPAHVISVSKNYSLCYEEDNNELSKICIKEINIKEFELENIE